MTLSLVAKKIASPVGRLTLVADDAGLVAVLWPVERPRRVPLDVAVDQPDHPVLLETERQLGAYFAGRLTRFVLPLAPRGTAFQRSVWDELVAIPFGETRSYAALARQIGRPAAVRAVGAANGRNPISIIIPCHRLVGSNGALTGFAGGLATKQWLLDLEATGRPG